MTTLYAERCAIIDAVSSETQARVVRTGKRFAKAEAEYEAAKAELVDAMLAESAEGTAVEQIARMTTVPTLGTTKAYRWMKAATAAPKS